jgi:hypothetical protein
MYQNAVISIVTALKNSNLEDVTNNILISNQIDARFLLYIFISILYMFRATLCSSSGESIESIHLVYVSVCRGPSGMPDPTCIPDGHLHRVTYIRCCIDTIDSPDDEHKVARNMQRMEINVYKRNCTSSWLFLRITDRIWFPPVHKVWLPLSLYERYSLLRDSFM